MNTRTHHHETEEQAAVAWNTRTLRVLAPETAAERDHLVKDRDSWKMLADSTNARCDRLVVVNKELVDALEELSGKFLETARVALDEARKP